MSLVKLIAPAGAQALGFAATGIAAVYWTTAPITQYGILLFVYLWVGIIFAAALFLAALMSRSWRVFLISEVAEQRSLFRFGSLHQMALLAGLVNALNGILQIYASPPNRTPPLVQALLTNTAPLFAVPFSKLFLGDRKRYCTLWPLFSAALVTLAIFCSVLPTLLAGRPDEGFELGWITAYLLSMVPAAAYSVVLQRFLLDSGLLRTDVHPADVALGTVRLLSYSHLYQPAWLLLLAWVDVLPAFGASTGSQLVPNAVFAVGCSFVGAGGAACRTDLPNFAPSEPPPVPVWAFLYVIGYVSYYAGMTVLSLESATFALLVNVAGSALMSVFFLLPGTNPAPAGKMTLGMAHKRGPGGGVLCTPVWSVILSLILCCAGVFLFKRWEGSMPLHEQFSWGDISGDSKDATKAGQQIELIARDSSTEGNDRDRDSQHTAEQTGLLAPLSPFSDVAADTSSASPAANIPRSLRRALAGVLPGGGGAAAAGSQSEHLLWEEQRAALPMHGLTP